MARAGIGYDEWNQTPFKCVHGGLQDALGLGCPWLGRRDVDLLLGDGEKLFLLIGKGELIVARR